MVKCIGPAGNTVYMPRETAESRASRVQGVRIVEEQMLPIPDLSGDANAERSTAKAVKTAKPRKPRGPNKKKSEPKSTADAN